MEARQNQPGSRIVHIEWEDGADASRLGLEGIGIEGRAVVLDVQVMEPFKSALHCGRPETGGIPVFQVFIDLGYPLVEYGPGFEFLPIMIETVYSHFKTIGGQEVSQNC